MEAVKYGSTVLEYELEYGDRRNMAIEVHPDKSVKVKAPLSAEKSEIDARIVKRGRWIKKQQNYFDQFLPRLPKREYVSGEGHRYLGRQYKLVVYQGKEKEVKLRGGELHLISPTMNPEVVKSLLSAWYYNHAIRQFEEVFKESLRLFLRYDVGIPRYELRRMKNRWGSCTTSGKIMVNPELIKAPKNCIRYVFIHELCHLVEPSHNRRFFRILEEVMPDWERWKHRLELVETL